MAILPPRRTHPTLLALQLYEAVFRHHDNSRIDFGWSPPGHTVATIHSRSTLRQVAENQVARKPKRLVDGVAAEDTKLYIEAAVEPPEAEPTNNQFFPTNRQPTGSSVLGLVLSIGQDHQSPRNTFNFIPLSARSGPPCQANSWVNTRDRCSFFSKSQS